MSDCPSLAELRSSLIGDLPEPETDIIFSHVESCQTCQASIVSIESEPIDGIENAIRQAGVPGTLPPNCQRMILDSSLIIKCERPGDSDSRSNDTWAAEETVRLIELIPGVDAIRDYLVRERLGQGGMGTVYRATHRHLKARRRNQGPEASTAGTRTGNRTFSQRDGGSRTSRPQTHCTGDGCR